MKVLCLLAQLALASAKTGKSLSKGLKSVFRQLGSILLDFFTRIWLPDNNPSSGKSGARRRVARSQRPYVEQNFVPYDPDIRYDPSVRFFRSYGNGRKAIFYLVNG